MSLDFSLPACRLKLLRSSGILVPDRAAVFRVEGSGALGCLQGLLTSDLAATGENGLSYGAVLTPKGMIVVDMWVIREADGFTLLLPVEARDRAKEHFGRVLPPRLARVYDLTAEWSVAWLLGPVVPADRLLRALLGGSGPVPGPGRVTRVAEGALLAAGGQATSPFAYLLAGPERLVAASAERFRLAGGEVGSEADVAAARILAGWPTLGREIDEKTLPQEVRYDELGAVSYVKGCYTGQETVARVHFRGHVNRTLRGLRFRSANGLPEGVERGVRLDGKDVGSVRSSLALEGNVLALATVRREVEDGAVVEVAGTEGQVTALPFGPNLLLG